MWPGQRQMISLNAFTKYGVLHDFLRLSCLDLLNRACNKRYYTPAPPLLFLIQRLLFTYARMHILSDILVARYPVIPLLLVTHHCISHTSDMPSSSK